MFRRRALAFLVLSGASLGSAGASEPGTARDQLAHHDRRDTPFVVVLDAGHGGHDVGTKTRGGATEKNIVLGIAHATAAQLGLLEGVRPLLTRDRDAFVGLGARLRRTREIRADVFVSIHANWAPSARARGAEVYFLSLEGAQDEVARASEDRENAAAVIGASMEHEASDPTLRSWLVDLNANAAMRSSEHLAATVLRRLREEDGSSRPVRQANFVVLRTLSMPSILVEVGFLSHREEGAWLASPAAQARIARSLAEGIVEYLAGAGERRSPGILPELSTHVVRAGETLESIAAAAGTDPVLLQRLNALPSARVRAGQRLWLP